MRWNNLFRLYFGFPKPFCLSIYRPTYFSELISLLLVFEHNCRHFQLRKVWHPEVLNFSATGNLQFYFIDNFGDNLWLAHQILVSGLFFRRLPPFTLWMDFPEAVKQIYPFVPRAFHSLWVSWRTSDIKTRNFIFLLLEEKSRWQLQLRKVGARFDFGRFNNKIIQSFRCRFWK